MLEQTMTARPNSSSPLRDFLNPQQTAVVSVANHRTAIVPTQGEIEAAVCAGLQRFEMDCLGRGPKDINAHLLGDMVVARLMGVLTAAELHLTQTCRDEKGRDLLKQTRTHLIEHSRPMLEAMVQRATGVKLISLHHDISTVVGEEIIVFTLAEPPRCRELKRR